MEQIDTQYTNSAELSVLKIQHNLLFSAISKADHVLPSSG